MGNTMTQALAGVTALCSWSRHHCLSTLPRFAQVSKWALVEFMLGVMDFSVQRTAGRKKAGR